MKRLARARTAAWPEPGNGPGVLLKASYVSNDWALQEPRSTALSLSARGSVKEFGSQQELSGHRF